VRARFRNRSFVGALMDVAFRRVIKITRFPKKAASERGMFIQEMAKLELAAKSAVSITLFTQGHVECLIISNPELSFTERLVISLVFT